MPFHDLHVTYSGDNVETQNTINFLAELDYSVVALAVSVVSKLPSQLPTVSIERLQIPQGLQILSRLNLTISDTSQNHRVNTLSSAYDLIVLRPVNDKALQLCCTALECDIISLDLAQRLPFPIKFKTVASALQRGIRFEICYSAGITGGNDARRNLISGAASLVRATRGRGIILSSEAKNALGVRAPWDVVNLAVVWGLSQERGKEALCEEAGKVVRLAAMKRTSFRGVVDIVEDGSKEITIEPRPTSADSTFLKIVENAIETGSATSSLPELKQVTVLPEKKPNNEKIALKRTASQALLNERSSKQSTDRDKPKSKREQKRQAKQVRLDRAAGVGQGRGEAEQGNIKAKGKDKANGFPVQHEALSASLKKKS